MERTLCSARGQLDFFIERDGRVDGLCWIEGGSIRLLDMVVVVVMLMISRAGVHDEMEGEEMDKGGDPFLCSVRFLLVLISLCISICCSCRVYGR